MSARSRNEAILENMLGAENEILPPMSRIETLLQELLTTWQSMLEAWAKIENGDDLDY